MIRLRKSILNTALVLFACLCIAPAMAKNYDLWIAGKRVTDANRNNLLNLPEVTALTSDAQCHFTPATNTLVLKDVEIKAERGENAITYKNVSSFSIWINGNSRLTAESAWGIFCKTAIKIEGTGRFDVNAVSGISVEGSLNVNDIELHSGIIRGADVDVDFKIKNAKLSVYAYPNYVAIADFRTVNLEDSYVIEPKGASYDPTRKCFVVKGTPVDNTIEIERIENYGISIWGREVTSVNCKDLKDLVRRHKEGYFDCYYNPKTKELYLNNVAVTSRGDELPIFNKKVENLVIKINNECDLFAENVAALAGSLPFSIKGPGTLKLTSQNNAALAASKNVTIEGVTLIASGTEGISCDPRFSSKLVIKNAIVTAKGSEAAINNFSSFKIEDGYIETPASARWDTEKKAIVDGGRQIAKHVEIRPGKEYDLSIAGVVVNDRNCADLRGIPGVLVTGNGSFSYDPVSKILRMKEVSINPKKDFNAINSRIADLIIVVSGKNTLRVSNAFSALEFFGTTKITGDGELSAISSNESGIHFYNTTLTLDGVTINAKGKYGISGHGSAQKEALVMNNATVTAEGSEGAMILLDEFSMENCYIESPKYGAWNAAKKTIVDLKGNIANKVQIIKGKQLPLYIADVQVTDRNCNDLSAIEGVTVGEDGEFKYDIDKKTLIMKNVSLTVGDKVTAIYNRAIKDLVIKVSGVNRISSSNWGALNFQSSTTITGEGSLISKSEGSGGIIVYRSKLTIDKTTVEAYGVYGIEGDNGDGLEHLIIKNASVVVRGAKAATSYITSFTLEDCRILLPVDANYSAEKQAVINAQGEPVTELIIGDGASVTGVTLSARTIKTKVNYSYKLTATVMPEDAAIKSVTWKSDNPAVATVNDGIVKGISIGSAEISVTTLDGQFTASCKVEVSNSTPVDDAPLQRIVITPNPFSNHLKVTTNGHSGMYKLLNAQGIVVVAGRLGNVDTVINTSTLAAGLYLLQLTTDNGAIASYRVVK